MSRPKAANKHVGANWAVVRFAHEVEVTRRGAKPQAARDGGGVGSLPERRLTARWVRLTAPAVLPVFHV
jgi:hypothetical protein